MPSSSTGIERSVSPSPRSRSLPLSAANGHDTRYRQPNTANHHLQQPHPFTPEVGYQPTSKVGGYSNGNGNGYLNGYAQTGGTGTTTGGGIGMLNGNQSAYSPLSHHHEQGTLSTLLTQLYRSAISTFSPSSSSSSSSNSQPFANISSSSDSSSLLNKLRPSQHHSSPRLSSSPRTPPTTTTAVAIPSASTVGFILLCCLWYLSSALSSNTGKSILTRFRYPVTLTFVQFAFVAGYSLLVLAVRNQLAQFQLHQSRTASGSGSSSKSRRSSFGAGAMSSMNTLQGWGVRKPSKHMFNGTLMMSLFQIAGHVFSSMAIARVPVSTVHTIKALSPLFTVLSYVALFGVRYSTPTYISLFPLTIGVMLACSFDLRANAIGFLCALGSTFIFVAQNIFSKKLLPKESSGGPEESKGLNGATSSSGGGGGGNAKLDKMNLLFYSSGMAFFLMIPIWLYSDASSLFFSTPSSTSSSSTTPTSENTTASLVFYFFLNGTVHFGQNLLAFSLLARTSPVTYSIASLVKRIAVICIAIVWFGQKVKPIQGFGMTLTFAGLYMYNQSKSSVEKGEKKRIMVEKKRGMELPTSLEDARAMDNSSSGTDSPLDGNTPIRSQSPRTRTSFEQAYNPYHPPPVPPPPHATGTSTHEGGQVSRNRQTSLPVTTNTSVIENGLNHHHQYNPYTSSSNSHSHSTSSAPPTHQIPQQHSPHTLASSGSAIQVVYR
ncbi:hypothetical protein JCM3765_006415 [Sporobolomyces pararoseus]